MRRSDDLDGVSSFLEISAQWDVNRGSAGLEDGLSKVVEITTHEAGLDKVFFNMDSTIGMMKGNFNSSKQQLKGIPSILSLYVISVEKEGAAGSILVDLNNEVGNYELAHVEKSRLVGGKARPNCPKWKRKARDHSGKSNILTDLQGKRKLEQVRMDVSFELKADAFKKLRASNPSNTGPVVLVLNEDMNLDNVSKMLDSDTGMGNFVGNGGSADFSSTYFSTTAKEQTARSL